MEQGYLNEKRKNDTETCDESIPVATEEVRKGNERQARGIVFIIWKESKPFRRRESWWESSSCPGVPTLWFPEEGLRGSWRCWFKSPWFLNWKPLAGFLVKNGTFKREEKNTRWNGPERTYRGQALRTKIAKRREAGVGRLRWITQLRGWEKAVQEPHWAVPRTPTKLVRLVDARRRGFHFMHKMSLSTFSKVSQRWSRKPTTET